MWAEILASHKFPGVILRIAPRTARGQKKTHTHTHKLFQNKLFAPPPKNPFFGPGKEFMCLISWERTQKGDPLKLFRGDFWGQKGDPKRAILGHKKLSLLFFFLPRELHRAKKRHPNTKISPKNPMPESTFLGAFNPEILCFRAAFSLLNLGKTQTQRI